MGVLSVGFLWWVMFFKLNLSQPIELVTATTLIFSITPFLFTLLIILPSIFSVPESEGNLFKWFREVWKRNVIGYCLWGTLDEAGQTVYELHPANETSVVKDGKKVHVAIPLKKGSACVLYNSTFMWDVYARHLVFLENHGWIELELRDTFGDRVGISVEDLLDVLILEHSSDLSERYVTDCSLERYLKTLLGKVRQGRELLKDRESAVHELALAAQKIDQTKRFMHSKEAGSIRDWLTERFHAHNTVYPVRSIPKIDA
jgi:hypothetical protein